MRQVASERAKPKSRAWHSMACVLFVVITIVQVRTDRPRRSADVVLPVAGSHPAQASNHPRFFSELSRYDGPNSAGLTQAIQIAMARAKRLFIETRGDEFVATGEPSKNAGGWTVHIEPKSGERDDILWLTVQDGRVTSFGFRRRYKLNGYTGKSKKGASPGYCRIDRG